LPEHGSRDAAAVAADLVTLKGILEETADRGHRPP